MSQSNSPLAIAKQLQTQLPSLIPAEALPELNQQLSDLITQAEQNAQESMLSNQLDFLFLDYPNVGEWLAQHTETIRSAKGPSSNYESGTRGFQPMAGKIGPISATDTYMCPIPTCGSLWTRMYRGEAVEDCDCQVKEGGKPVKRVPVR